MQHEADSNGEVVTFFRKAGIVCGGITALWVVLSQIGVWTWNYATAPMIAQQAQLARAVDTLAAHVAQLEHTVNDLHAAQPPRHRVP